MNQGLFGIAAGASSGSSKLRIRKPFSVNEQNKEGIRVSNLGSHAFGKSAFLSFVCSAIAASPTAAVMVGYSNASVPAGTTSSYRSTDGITWTVRTITSGIYSNVVWTGTRFIAHVSGSTTRVDSTDDGLNWVAGTALPATTGFILLHNGKLYQFPTSGTIYYEFTTTDAAASTTRTSPANYAAPTNMISACGALIETVSASQLRYSYDGVAWNTAASPGFVPIGITGNSSVVVAYDADGQYNVSNTAGATWLFEIPKVFDATSLGLVSEVATTSFGSTIAGTFPLISTSINFASIQNGTNPASLGERMCIKFVFTHRTDVNGAISSNLFSCILHSTTGLSWTLEYPRFGTNSVQYNSSKSCPFNNKWLFCEYNTAAVSQSYVTLTNPDFEELIYDV